jgi:threonylcarbamoyladenosine tRNA methylthiotransferase MtaB
MIDNSTFDTRTALFHTFGCKLNFSETSTIARMLAECGIRRVTASEKPDFIVVNTCSVTELADKKCRQTIRSFNRKYPDAAIIVIGCYAQLKSEEVAALPGVCIVAGNDRKAEICDFVNTWCRERKPQTIITPAKDIRKFTPSCDRGDRTRFFLKVQDGCDYWCTYCTIPMARGRSRSATIDELVAQANQAAEEGGREIVITGVNIGDFGKGRDDNFLDLCRELDKVEGIKRYRISSIEPNLLTDEIIEFVAQSRAFMPHFHVPLQSGSDEVLKLMRRHYDTSLFAHKMQCIREAMPDAFIGIDLIVGARGETDACFEDSYNFISSLPISRLHVFTYSERPGTRALEIPHVVSQELKHKRTTRMLGLSEKMLADFASRFEGTVRPVLLEHPRRNHPMSGFTDNYLKIEVEAPAELDNHIVNVKLGKYNSETESFNGTLI